MNNKKIIIIPILVILAIISAVVSFYYLDSKNTNNSPVVEQINIDQLVNQNSEYQGEIVKLDDGWKRYTNQAWGISFEFRDLEDKVRMAWETSDSITFIRDFDSDEEKFIYINRYGRQYSLLEDYLNENWNSYQESAELVSINKMINKNGVELFKVVADVNGGMQSPGEIFRDATYYTQYPYFPNSVSHAIRSFSLLEFRNVSELDDFIIQSFRFINVR